MEAIPINGPNGVDDVAGRETVTAGDAGLSGGASAKGGAFTEQVGAGGPVDGTNDTTPAEEGTIGRVNNGVDVKARDVALDEFYSFVHNAVVLFIRFNNSRGGRG